MRLKAGDTGGLEPLVRRYQLPALRVAYGVTQRHDLAEDAVHDAFLTVLERIEQFDEQRPFRPWFYRIVINYALKAARRAAREQLVDDSLARAGRRADPAPGPEEQAVNSELRELLKAAMAVLTPEQRTVLVLRYYLQLNEREMAVVLGRPAGTVKWRLHAARRRLRDVLGSDAEPAALVVALLPGSTERTVTPGRPGQSGSFGSGKMETLMQKSQIESLVDGQVETRLVLEQVTASGLYRRDEFSGDEGGRHMTTIVADGFHLWREEDGIVTVVQDVNRGNRIFSDWTRPAVRNRTILNGVDRCYQPVRRGVEIVAGIPPAEAVVFDYRTEQAPSPDVVNGILGTYAASWGFDHYFLPDLSDYGYVPMWPVHDAATTTIVYAAPTRQRRGGQHAWEGVVLVQYRPAESDTEADRDAAPPLPDGLTIYAQGERVVVQRDGTAVLLLSPNLAQAELEALAARLVRAD